MRNITDRITILNKIYPNFITIQIMDLKQNTGTKVVMVLTQI